MAETCLTGEGYLKGAEALLEKRRLAFLIQNAAPIATAWDAADNMINIAGKAYAIADRKMSLAEEQLEFNKLAWPCEESTITEVMQEPEYLPIYDVVVGRSYAPVKAEHVKLSKSIKRAYNRYSTGAIASQLTKLCAAEKISLGIAGNNAWRAERERADAYNDRKWNRQLQMASLGKNIPTQISNFYNSAGEGLAGKMNAAGNQFNNALNAIGMFTNQYVNGDPYVSQQFQDQFNMGTDGSTLQGATTYALGDAGVANGTPLGSLDGGTLGVSSSLVDSSITSSTYSDASGSVNYAAENYTFGQNVDFQADSTVKSFVVKGNDSDGDSINITVTEKDITYTNANDPNLTPTSNISGELA